MERNIDIGDEVAMTATILMVRRSGRACVSIPSHSLPFAIEPPRKAKPGDKVAITGHVTSVDDEAGKVTVKISARVIVEIDTMTAHRKLQPSERQKPFRERWE
ncbi:hypothetical protein [Mesorhizobium sp. B2-1-3A]|uniref:hypothetical protein n=1 Tax=Mesorhizobium sp. B2-1-3A TaxID=2589971 RepID=UPI00112C7E53|nr:hypothetical protein [Mesorhizobium sp. B2-1-3A]TPM94472.1 hypothetical protein FJ977_20360 [Mesorhizobium sp. B2-1-3A]